ncbi:MAG: ATP-dependent metalloprotease, partial [Elusimicrobiota bacterium]
QPGYSNETARNVDEEVKQIVNSCYEKAKKILSENRNILNAIASRLMEKEIIESDEIEDLFQHNHRTPNGGAGGTNPVNNNVS